MYLKVQKIGSMYVRFSFENILVSYEYAFNIFSHICTFREFTLQLQNLFILVMSSIF